MFDAILKTTNSSFQRGMTFCRSIYVMKVMTLLALIFEQPSYLMILFLPKFMINVTILNLKLSISILDCDVPRSTSYRVYISRLIRFARASSHAADFNTRNTLITQKLLKQGYQYQKLRKTFSKFYRIYYELISKFQIGHKSLLHQGLSEPEF